MTKRFAFFASLIPICALVVFAGGADGTWTAAGAPKGARQALTLRVNGTVLTGTADGVPITDGMVQGSFIWFNAVRSGVAYSYKGTVSPNRLDLHESRADGSHHRALTFNRN